MPGPVETSLAALAAMLAAALGGYGFTLYMKGDPVSQSIEPANVKTFELTAGKSLPTAYQEKLLDITKKSNLSSIVQPISENKDWWEWAFQFKFQANKSSIELDPVFSAVTSGYAASGNTSLNKVCENVYKQDKTKFNAEDNKFVSNAGAFCTTSSQFVDISEPEAIVYAGDSAPQEYEKGVLGVKANRLKLVKTNEVKNKFWWDWAFKKLLTDSLKKTANEPFKTLTLGYQSEQDSGNKKSLNNACDAAYKKPYKDIKPTTQGTTEKQGLKTDMSNFCSVSYATSGIDFPPPLTPAFVSSNSDFSNKYKTSGSVVLKESNKDKLVDPENPENENWWVWMYDMFFIYEYAGTRTNQKPTTFKLVAEPYKTINGGGSNDSLNKACKEAYGKTSTQLTESNKDNLFDVIKKFCSPSNLSEGLVKP